MNNHLRRFVRPVLFLLLATGFSACCFHGHHGLGRGWGHCVPVRHCR